MRGIGAVSRAHDDDQFRLAFTLLLLDQYEELADAAWEQAPTLVPHAVVVEALTMVDEANAYVDPDTGLEEAVPATTDWLAEWTLKAIGTISRDGVRRDRLPDKDPGWRVKHEERLSLLAKLAALGERRLPAVMTLLGWPDTQAIEALASMVHPIRLTADRYRSLAEDGTRRLVEALDPAGNGSTEGQLAGLRWSIESVMAPLVSHPGSTHLTVDEADFAALLGGATTERDPPPFTIGTIPAVEQPGEDAAIEPGAPDAVAAEPETADEPVAPSTSEADRSIPKETRDAWWADEVVRLDGPATDLAGHSVTAAVSGRPSAVRDGARRRVLAASGVASILAAVVGIVALSGPGRRHASAPGRAVAATDVAKVHARPTKAKPKARAKTAPVATRKGTAARSGSSTPKAKAEPRPATTRAALSPPAERSTVSVPRRVAAIRPARLVWRAPVVTARDIQAEFLP